MKTLTIQQPFATLICIGLKDVENRSWKTKVPPGRILIHASGKKLPKSEGASYIGTEAISIMNNLKQFGLVTDEMPLSAIIGYVDVVGFAKDSKSPWAVPGSIHWLLENARVFEKPITGVKGQLGIFDYPMDENNLPAAHTVGEGFPKIKGKKMTVNVGDEDWDRLGKNPEEFRIDTGNDYIESLICREDDHMEPKPVSSIKFVHGGDTMEFKVKGCKSDYVRDKNNNCGYYAVYELGERIGNKPIDKHVVRVAFRCIYYMPVIPSCDIVDMDMQTWNSFRFADTQTRKQIALSLLRKKDMDGKIKEVVWIPLNDQDKLLLAPCCKPIQRINHEIE